MASSLAVLVHKRYGFLAFFLLIGLGVSIWFTVISLNNWRGWWILLVVLHAVATFLAISVFARINLQKISFKFRSGVLIKIVFSLSGLLTILSGILVYLIVIEQTSWTWPVITIFVTVLFVTNLISLIIAMTVRYAIEEDVKKRKVCEFC